eukprot:scaffold120994_cov39-Phaeocystis_antarctica.AAC.1
MASHRGTRPVPPRPSLAAPRSSRAACHVHAARRRLGRAALWSGRTPRTWRGVYVRRTTTRQSRGPSPQRPRAAPPPPAPHPPQAAAALHYPVTDRERGGRGGRRQRTG